MTHSPTPTNADDVTVRQACPLCQSIDLSDVETEQVDADGWAASITCNSCDTVFSTAYTEPSPNAAANQMRKQFGTCIAHQSTGQVERLREALEEAQEWLNYEEVSRLGPAERKVYDRLMEKVDAALAIKGGGDVE